MFGRGKYRKIVEPNKLLQIGELYIGNIGVDDNSDASSGATLIGLYDDAMTYVAANTTVQGAIKELDTALIALAAGDSHTVTDNTANALSIQDDGGTPIEYMRIVSLDAQPLVVFNEGGVDVDFRVEGAGDANALFIQGSSDRVGIHTASPLSPFHVSENTNNTGTTAGLTIENAGGGDAVLNFVVAGDRWAVGLDNSDADKFKIASSAGVGTSERLTITQGGLVGMGTATPGARLELAHATSPQFKISYEDTALNYATFAIAADGALTITTVDADAAEGDIILMPDGYVGILNATPTEALDVTGNIVASGTITGTATSLSNTLTFTGATGINEIIVPDNLADALSLEDAGGITYLQVVSTDANPYVLLFPGGGGNVGVGTTGPTSKLHVDQASASGAIPVLKLDQGDVSEQHIVCSMSGADVDYPAIIELDVTGSPAVGWNEADDVFTSSHAIRTTTTLYRRYYHMPLFSADPGASGATWTDADGDHLCGWQLNLATETLEFQADIHNDWDGTSDLTVEISIQILAAAAAGETVDLKLVCYYLGVGDSATKTQTVEVATNVGGGAGVAQFTAFHIHFTIDEDAGGNNVDPGDVICFILNLETDTSEVDDVLIIDAAFHYNTTHLGIEAGDA